MIDTSKENLLRNFIKFPQRNILLLIFLLGFGEWFISDIVNFSGGSFGFIILCIGGYIYLKNGEPKFNEPKDINGWINLCKDDLKAFEELNKLKDFDEKNIERTKFFNQILNNPEKQKLTIIGSKINFDYKKILNNYFEDVKYDLNLIEELPSLSNKNKLPESLLKCDAIFYQLELPLTAKGLLWIKKFPQEMPIWFLLSDSERLTDLDELKAEIPEKLRNNIINIDQINNKFIKIPFSFRKFTINPKKNLANTQKRLLKQLHFEWQAEIEVIRRLKLKEVQRKNQIIVAATVFASPIPSIDVLSMTVLNSLMIKEIRSIWGCSWSPEIIEKLSKQIIKTAIAQGVVEWSGQTLLNFSKFHGPNWILAGSYQAISAAYLTRVVSRSLADFMAISKGVSEPDLEFIKNNSDRIVKDAFETEKINWKTILSDFEIPLKLKFD